MVSESSEAQGNRAEKPIGSLAAKFADASNRLAHKVVGQYVLVERLLLGLLSDGHLLVEGAPGLAKTRAIKSLSEIIEGDFHRVQFTPDLLPGDLTGTDIYQPADASFTFKKGPIFHNLVLADEINRAPAKVQSALLEAMAERQVTIGSTSHNLPDLFMVMATQNPIEQEGTYPLPEAQLDRFLMHVRVDYPSRDLEGEIVALARAEALGDLSRSPSDTTPESPILTLADINQARTEVLSTFTSPAIDEYIVQLILATRKPSAYAADLGDWIQFGASPRGTIGLDRVSRARAWLNGRDYVSPDDVQKTIHDVLRHRIILSFSAEAEGITPDRVIDRLLDLVPVT